MRKLKLLFACLLMTVLGIGQLWADTYTLVTDVSQVTTGDKVIVATNESDAPSSGVTGWNGSKDATVSDTEADWIQYEVTAVSGGWNLYDPKAEKYIKSPGSSNQFLYDATSKGTCSVNENGVLKCNNRYLCKNGSYYRMYISVGSYPAYCVWKVTTSSGPALTSITVSGTPNQTVYESGDVFDPAGLTVTGYYDNSTNSPITSGITWTAYNGESYVALASVPLTAEQTSLKVKATVGEVTSAEFTVSGLTVTAALPVIEITAASSGITTTYGDGTFVQNGVSFSYKQWMKSTNFIQAKASTNSSLSNTTAIPGIIKSIEVITGSGKTARAVTVKGGASSESLSVITAPATAMSMTFDFGSNEYSYFALNTPGNACYFDKIIIRYEPVAAKELSSIAVKTNPTKTSYIINDAFDATGLVITATYDDMSTEDIAYVGNEEKFSFAGFSSASAAAAQTITVTYGEKTTTFNVEIQDITLQSVTVSGKPTTTSYTAGDTFDPEGLTVTGHYSDNSDVVITTGITWSYPDNDSELSFEQTSIRVVATVEEIASAPYPVSGLTVAAAPLIATWVASEQGYADQTDMTKQTIAFGPESDFSLVFLKASASNPPKYYATGTAVRAYGGSTFTLSSTNYNFTQIVITFGTSDGSNAITTDVETYDAGTWTGNSKQVTFTIDGTTGNRRISAITIDYEAAMPTAATPTFSVEGGSYLEAQSVELTTATAGATIYYTTDGSTPTTASSVYSTPIAVSTDMTIKAIAVKEGMDNSAVASATYAIRVYASLDALVAADLAHNTTVKVSFSNVAIKTVDGARKYVTFDIQKDGKDIEIYFNSELLPTTWVAGGTLSGTITAPWVRYPATGTLTCWELKPEAGWSWNSLTYVSPITKTIHHVTVSGTATKTKYVDGEVFDPAGLVVTLYYTDETNDVVTEGILWAPTTALTEGTTSVNVTATVNEVTSATYPVSITVSEIPTKTIAEFIVAGGGRCYLVGVVSNLTNNNKNCTLTDNSGEILLYKIYDNGVETDFVTLDVEEGDRIKVIATTYQVYNQKDEVVAPEFVEELAPEVVAVTGVTVAPTTATVKVGKTVTLTATVQPALATNTNVTWESDNTEVATVDENGVVTGVAEGTAHITVTTEDGSFPATATITVEAAPSFTGGEWVLVTDVAQLNINDYIIIASSSDYNKAMSTQNSNNRAAVDVTITGDILTYAETVPVIFTLKAGYVDGQYAFYDEDADGYLYAASSSSNWLRTQATVDGNASWAITIANGETSVVAQGSYTRNKMQYNNSNNSNLFSCYNNSQKAVDLYKYYSTPALKLTYDMNGGTGAIANAIANGENQVTITSTIPERVGYNFTGWNTASDGSGIGYTAGNVVILSANLTLYAQWEDEPVDGEEMVIIVKNGDKYYAMGQVVIGDNRMNAVELTDGIIGDKMINVPTEDRAAITWIRKEKNDGFTFQAQNGKYLVGDYKTDLKLGDEPTLWKFDAENGYYYTMLSGTKRTFIQGVVSGTEVFRNYDADLMNTGNYSGASVYLNEYIDIDNTKEIVTLRSGLENGKIGTMCWNAAIYEVEGAYFFEPEMKQADGVCFAEAAKEGGVYPAGKPYVFQATGEKIRAVVSSTTDPTTVAGTNNGLHGTFVRIDVPNGEGYYIIYQNKLYTANNNYIEANRAYIDKSQLPGASSNPAPGRRRLVIGRDNLPTGVDAVVLDGEQVQKVLIDGQIYIVRDGKMYDLTGRMIR